MSENVPFGTPLEGPVDQLNAPPVAPSEPSGRRRTLIIAAGSAVVLAAAGIAAVVLTGGGSEDPTPFTMPTPRHSTSAPTPTSSVSVSLLPTETAVNARNPFLRPPSDPATSGAGATGGSGAGGSGGAATVTATKTMVAAGPTSTVKSTSTVKTTVSSSPTSVFAMVYSIAGTAGSPADFQVASGTAVAKYLGVVIGQKFGPGNVFTYQSTASDGSITCANVKYVDEVISLCPGNLAKVH